MRREGAPVRGAESAVAGFPSAKFDRRRHMNLSNQRGELGWVVLWLLGIPIPLLLVLFVLRGCT